MSDPNALADVATESGNFWVTLGSSAGLGELVDGSRSCCNYSCVWRVVEPQRRTLAELCAMPLSNMQA